MVVLELEATPESVEQVVDEGCGIRQELEVRESSNLRGCLSSDAIVGIKRLPDGAPSLVAGLRVGVERLLLLGCARPARHRFTAALALHALEVPRLVLGCDGPRGPDVLPVLKTTALISRSVSLARARFRISIKYVAAAATVTQTQVIAYSPSAADQA